MQGHLPLQPPRPLREIGREEEGAWKVLGTCGRWWVSLVRVLAPAVAQREGSESDDQRGSPTQELFKNRPVTPSCPRPNCSRAFGWHPSVTPSYFQARLLSLSFLFPTNLYNSQANSPVWHPRPPAPSPPLPGLQTSHKPLSSSLSAARLQSWGPWSLGTPTG